MNNKEIILTQQQLIIINNSILNILAGPYAIDNDNEFHTLIGGSKEDAEVLLKYIGSQVDSV